MGSGREECLDGSGQPLSMCLEHRGFRVMRIPNCQLVLNIGSGGYQVFNIHLCPKTMVGSIESVEDLILDSTEGDFA